jgi:CheY-like chemotaxis protein
MLFNVVKHANVRRAAIVVQQQDRSIRLTVLDRGRGFEPDRLDAASQNGFGLFNIRERIQLLGGSMTVHSTPGRGSRFVLTIPQSVPGKKTTHKSQTPILATSTASTTRQTKERLAAAHKHRVLLVDDHKVMRDGLAALLEEEPDIEVVGQAGNGRDAITLTAQLKPDVVVMDVVMPIIDGEEATRQIRARWPRVRVVALSMLEEDTTRDRMLKAGAETFLSKAGPSEVIAAAIRRSS